MELHDELEELNGFIQQVVEQVPLSAYSDKEFICVAILSFVEEIRKSLAAMNVYGLIECHILTVPEDQKVLWEINVESVWRRLVSDLTKLFDKDSTCGKVNCSLLQLKKFCLRAENTAIFPSGESDPLIIAIDELKKKYDTTVSSDARNKKVAHHDLAALRNDPPSFINLSDINELVEVTTETVTQITSKLLPIDFVFPPIIELQQHYEKALRSMLSITEAPDSCEVTTHDQL